MVVGAYRDHKNNSNIFYFSVELFLFSPKCGKIEVTVRCLKQKLSYPIERFYFMLLQPLFLFCIQQGDVIPYQSFLLAALQKLCRAVHFLYDNVAVQQNYLTLVL